MLQIPVIPDYLNNLPRKAVESPVAAVQLQMKALIMKKLILVSSGFGVAAVAFVLAAGCSPLNSSAEAQPSPAPVATVNPPPVEPVPETALAAPVLPAPHITPGSPLAQVVRLTQAGVDPTVIASYVANSTDRFNLDSEQIIYLANIGVPNSVINAMMQRDQQLPATQSAQAPQPAAVSTAYVAAPPVVEPATVTMDYFYESLTPYGSWVVVNGYGRCWRPTTVVYDPNWQPYCDHGHWVYTDAGWYWDSEYSWGATFHYGRWFRDANQGWCWYPDTAWAPSWVTWRYSDNYCGWAPLPPRTVYREGAGIVFVGGGAGASISFGLGAGAFIFVATEHFCDEHPRNHRVEPAQVTQIFNHTTVINNYNINVNNHTVINHGIEVQNISRAAHTDIHQVSIHDLASTPAHLRNSPGQGANRPATQTHFQPTPAQTPVPNQNNSAPQNPPSQFNRARNNAPATIPQRSVTVNNQTPPAVQNVPPAPNAQSQQFNRTRNNNPAAIPQNPPQVPGQNISPNQNVSPAPTAANQFNRSRNNPGANQPQRNTPLPGAAVQPPPANYNEPPPVAPTRWQQAIPNGTPRDVSRNPRPHQDESSPVIIPTPQPAAPANPPASSSPSSGGSRNDGNKTRGNQNWGGR